ncbi:MAG: EamA family transporter [Burkholderiaceae bacterium]
MSPLALLLVVIAAFTHASWNLLAKRAAHCRHFNWYYSTGAALLFLPLAAFALIDFAPRLSVTAVLVLLSTCVLHALYSESLQRGYRAADLSVVYPIARGTGPLISFVGAIFVLGEHPSLVATAGALLVVAGVLVLAGGRRLWRELRTPHEARGTVVAGLYWGGLTGLLIAAYTLNDGYAVKVLLIPPLLVDYVGNLFRSLVLAPRALRDRAAVALEYPRFWREALGVSILGPAGYILVLYAMTMAPVSHVAPAREMSMMIGAWFGARLLGEGHVMQRVLGAGLIVAGVGALALG